MNGRRVAFGKALIDLRKKRKAGKFNAPSAGGPEARASADGPPYLDELVCGDSVQVLNDGPEAWIDLVFADPPFNIGYLYHGYDDRLKAEDYLEFSRNWMKAVHRALKPTGSFYLAIGDEFAADLCVIARRELGFTMRNWIIWHYTFGQQPTRKFAKSHTHILYFTKDPAQFTFNADAIRVPSARQTIYADARANPKGKLPDDVWYLRPQEATASMFLAESDTWNVSRICGTFKEREGWHGCQMPIDVLKRIIAASSNTGDMVVDPFNGSGTTTVAAALQGRRYVGIDQSEEYVGFARARLAHACLQLPVAKENAPNPHPKLNDPARASRIPTLTDSLGRPRVERARAKRTA
ncbi:MAG TPA: site-specific DNA-methyltransferase [Tepidisphaeraceae bacterium]|jgi:site-specific DNA-methyltransferase (adenine-specific)|nr:site-specific DNA-methyltransferase [Tepidisphaeraceae bacterium]